MFSLLVEGLESAFFPCTLVLLIPGLAVTFASRHFSTLAILGFTVGLILNAWFIFSGRTGDWHGVILAALLLAAGLLFLRPITNRLELTSLTAGTLVGVATAALWQPCVGNSFGTLLNELPTLGASGPLRLGVYMIGLLAPLFIVGALFYLVPDGVQESLERPLAYIGAFSLILIAFAIITGVHETVISQLFAWSNAQLNAG